METLQTGSCGPPMRTPPTTRLCLLRTLEAKPSVSQGQVRVVEIRGFDGQACGGTHVNATSDDEVRNHQDAAALHRPAIGPEKQDGPTEHERSRKTHRVAIRHLRQIMSQWAWASKDRLGEHNSSNDNVSSRPNPITDS